MRSRRAAAFAFGALLVSACGTTVPLATQQQAGTGGSGLGLPGETAQPGTSTPAGPDTSAPGGPAPGALPSRPGSVATTAPGAGPVPSARAGGRVTAPLVVGVLGIKRVAELASTAGVSTGQTFAPTDAFRAAAKRYGGTMQGRKLSLAVAEIDPNSSSYSSDYEAACQRLTRDSKAAVVLSLDVIGVEAFSACLRKAGVLQVNTGYSGFDRDGYRSYPNVINLGAPDIDARVTAVMDGSLATGRLRSGDSVGVVVEQCAGDERAYERSLLPALKKANATVTRFDVSCINGPGGLGAAGSGLSGAVLRFQAARVTKVVFVSNFEGALVLLMAPQSESQGFRPTYLLSSTAAVASTLDNFPAGQRPGLTGVGWMPSADVSAGTAPTTAGQRACVATMRSAGLDTSGSLDAIAAYSACDSFSLLDRLLAHTGGASTLSALRAGLGAVSGRTPVTSVLGEAVRLDVDRPTGPVQARPWQWIAACDCLRYTGAARPLSP